MSARLFALLGTIMLAPHVSYSFGVTACIVYWLMALIAWRAK